MDDEGSSTSSGNIFAAATQVAPIYPLYVRDANGNIRTDDNGNTMYDYGDGMNAGLNRPVYGQSNAISSAILDTNEYNGNQFNGLGYIELRYKDFKFTSNNSVGLNEMRQTNVTNPYYGQYSSSNGIVYKYHTRDLTYTFQQILNYSHLFNGKHNVNLTLVHENNWEKSTLLYGSKSNMFDPNNTELTGAVIDRSASSYTGDYNNEGYIFRAQYDYIGKYFGSASFRRDGSSRFHPDHRWGNFWSVGGAWIISKEDFFHVDWVDMLKFKASYGEQGNDRIGSYRYTNTYSIVNSNGTAAVQPSTMGNENITWEKGGNFNAGFEFNLFKNRLTGSIEGFYRKTTDMLSYFTLPSSFGFTGYYDNVGDMQNGGLELDLTANIIRTKDFNWDFNFNMTWYKNKITRIADDNKSVEIEGNGGYVSGSYFYGENNALYTFYMPKFAGVNPENGNALYYVDVTGDDGTVTRGTTETYADATYYLCGTALPSTYGGFGTSLEYKDFDFSINFAYQLGGQVYDSDYATYMTSPTGSSRGYALHQDLLNAWSETNMSSNIPRFQFNDEDNAKQSDRFLTNASYLSLQNINFGYSLPRSVMNKIKLSKIRFYFAAENVWLWSKRQGLNPQQSISGGASTAYYAPIRTLTGGINVTF
jgi:TonB-linked SusC/RagA family outer membrane protein